MVDVSAGTEVEPRVSVGAAGAVSAGLAVRGTTTASADWRILDRLTLSAVVRYESGRFDDDLNQNPLGTALTENARLTWTINRHADLFLNGENLSDARVATAVNTDGTISYGEPRIISVGVSFRR